MTNGHCGIAGLRAKGAVFGRQHGGQWFADDIATSHNDCPLAGYGDSAAMQNLQAAKGSAGQEPWPTLHEQADVFRMETIDILENVHRIEHPLRTNMFGNWHLDQDAMYAAFAVQPMDDL